MKEIIIGITGASGSVLADVITDALMKLPDVHVHLVCTANGAKVLTHELGCGLAEFVAAHTQTALVSNSNSLITLHDNTDLFAPISSGSYRIDAMVVIPASMGTVAKIACGISDNLLTRAADVMIKENRKLVLVVRESPLSAIHLENMLKLSHLGVVIAPPLIPYYNAPDSITDSNKMIVGRILVGLGFETSLHKVWSEQ